MNEEDFAGLMRGIAEAKAYLAGERNNCVVHAPEQILAQREKREGKA